MKTNKHLKNILIPILTIICLTNLKGQQILVEQTFNGYTDYGQHAKVIESVTELPDQIQTALEAYITDMVGSNINNVAFSHGQNVDLKSYFCEPNRKASSYQWVVPAYDLNYVLSDTTLGIKSYYLQIRLDEYGQLLRANWPRKGYLNKGKVQSISKIVQFAVDQANSRGYLTSKYVSDLKFNSDSESLNWLFQFPETLNPDNKQFDVLEISLTSLRVVDEYTIIKTVYN